MYSLPVVYLICFCGFQEKKKSFHSLVIYLIDHLHKNNNKKTYTLVYPNFETHWGLLGSLKMLTLMSPGV